jgi:hypothetical protein
MSTLKRHFLWLASTSLAACAAGCNEPVVPIGVTNNSPYDVVVFGVMPGDQRNPNSNLSKAQNGAPVSDFDAETSRVVDRGNSDVFDVPKVRGAQGGVCGLDDEGDAIPPTTAGAPPPSDNPNIPNNYNISGGGSPDAPAPLNVRRGSPTGGPNVPPD